MSDKIIKNPHDRFFKTMMENSEVIRDFFQQHLPDNIKSIINYDSIAPKNNSFIDDHLRLQESDVLYDAEFNGQTGYLYLLVEHVSSPCEMMPFRLLKYMLAIMDKHILITQENRLPLIVPIIVYNGWKNYLYSTDLFDLFGSEKNLAKEILLKPYQLIDLSKIPDAKLKLSIKYGVMAYVMKHIYNKEFLPILENVVENLKLIEKNNEIDYIYKVLSYILEAGEIDREVFFKTVRTKLSSISGERIMTVAEQFKQEGVKLGE